MVEQNPGLQGADGEDVEEVFTSYRAFTDLNPFGNIV